MILVTTTAAGGSRDRLAFAWNCISRSGTFRARRESGGSCEKTGWRIHAYVLMGNRYHLLVETPEPNLAAARKGRHGTWKGGCRNGVRALSSAVIGLNREA